MRTVTTVSLSVPVTKSGYIDAMGLGAESAIHAGVDVTAAAKTCAVVHRNKAGTEDTNMEYILVDGSWDSNL